MKRSIRPASAASAVAACHVNHPPDVTVNAIGHNWAFRWKGSSIFSMTGQTKLNNFKSCASALFNFQWRGANHNGSNNISARRSCLEIATACWCHPLSALVYFNPLLSFSLPNPPVPKGKEAPLPNQSFLLIRFLRSLSFRSSLVHPLSPTR